MRILILGASSAVGSALAAEFAPGNSLLLAGRERGRLAATEERCRRAGALDATSIAADLAEGTAGLLQAIDGSPIDLLIDAASAASGSRDADMEHGQLAKFLCADLTSKMELLDHLLDRQREAPAVIFISTALVLVNSPGRAVYASLKRLHEAYLRKTSERRRDLRLLVVRVGTVIDPKNPSGKPEKLARAGGMGLTAGRTVMFFGVSGALLVGLFYLQPLVFGAATLLQRRIRQLRD